MQDKIVINDYIENDPLSKENLDKTLEKVNKIRLLSPNKTIWLYTGYMWKQIFNNKDFTKDYKNLKRREVVKQCDILIDGQYIDSLRDTQLKWRGSSNQRVINIKESLKQKKIVLYCE